MKKLIYIIFLIGFYGFTQSPGSKTHAPETTDADSLLVLTSDSRINHVKYTTLLDKLEIDLSIGASTTNLSTSQTSTTVTINSDTGTDATIPLANGTNAGVSQNNYATAEKSKLSWVSVTQAVDLDTMESDISTNTAHGSNTSNPHSVTKAQVGLSNVDNTSDANKPISTATQAALDDKDGSETKVTAGTNVTVSGLGTTASPYVINSTASGGSGNPAIYIVDEASDLTGDQSANANKVWSVQGGTIDMASASITLPAGVYLRYDGGELINGTIDLNGGRIDPELIDYRLTLAAFSGTLKEKVYHFDKTKAGITESTSDSTITENNKHRWNHIVEQIHNLHGGEVHVGAMDAEFSVYSVDNRGVDQWDNDESLKLYGDITYKFSDSTYFRVRADNAWGSALFNTSRQDNITIIGGNFIGDRATHDYSVPLSDPTRFSHEFGTLLNIVGSHNVKVIGVNMQQPTADCIIIDGTAIRNPDGTVVDGERESRNILIEGCTIEYGRRNNISVLDGVQITINNNDIGYAGAGYNFDPNGSVGAWGRLPMYNIDFEPYQATSTTNSSQALKYEDAYLIRVTNNRFYGAMKGDINTFKGWRVLIDNNSFTNTYTNQFAYDNTFSNNTLVWDESLRQGKEDTDSFTATGGETSHALQYTAMPVGTYFEDFYITVNGTPLVETTEYTISGDRTTVNFVSALTASDAVIIKYYYEQPTPVKGIGVNDLLTVHAGGNFSQVYSITLENNSVRGYDIGMVLNGNGTKAIGNYIYDFTRAGISGGGSKLNYFEGNHLESSVSGVYGVEIQNEDHEVIIRKNVFKIPNGSFCYLDDVNDGVPSGNIRVNLSEIGDSLDDLTVNGVSIINSAVTATTTNEATTAGQIVSAINAFTSTPNYTATLLGTTVTILHEDSANDGGEYFEVTATVTDMVVSTANFGKSPKNYILLFQDNVIEAGSQATVRDTYGFNFIGNITNAGFTGYDYYRGEISNNKTSKRLPHSFLDILYNFVDMKVSDNILEIDGDEAVHFNGIDNRGLENCEIIDNEIDQTGGSYVIRVQRGEEEMINNLFANNRIEKDGSQASIHLVGTNNTMINNYSYKSTVTYNLTGTGNIVKIKYPDPSCPSYADNATALAALGEGWCYKNIITGQFDFTHL